MYNLPWLNNLLYLLHLITRTIAEMNSVGLWVRSRVTEQSNYFTSVVLGQNINGITFKYLFVK